MRLLYVCEDRGIPVFGAKGASVHVQEVLRVFVQRGWKVDLVTPRTGGVAPDDLTEVTVHHPEKGIYDQLAAKADLVYERYSLWGGEAMRAAREWLLPAVLETNSPLIDEHLVHRGDIDIAKAEAHLVTAVTNASVIACVSQGVARWVVTHPALRHLEQLRRRVIVTPNGVNCQRFRPVPRPRRRWGKVTVGFVSTLKPWHGVDHLLDAIAMLPGRIQARIIGDGPERQRLLDRCVELGIDKRVCFIGPMAPAAIPHQLNSIDIAVAPYPAGPDLYFSPLKMFEYAAASLPIVASAIGQVSSVLTHDETALLVPPGDARALASAIQELADDPDLRDRLGRNARDLVLHRHTWDFVVDSILDQLLRNTTALFHTLTAETP